MPKSKKKAGKNAKGKLASAGSMYVSDSSGFSVKHQQTTIAEVSWDQVQAIYAYTKVCDGIAGLSLQIVLPEDKEGNEQSLTIDDSVEGWQRLKEDLIKVFPALNKDWENVAAFEESTELADLAPTYFANINEVWRRKRKPRN